ncbi:MAG: hypothetical protein ISS34_05975 [Candidatus Omnitrophica bacterium]|nr:hypothetical protein [Candidatus Omnitrophota bacterium]
MGKSFATTINCIDGRVQKPIIEFAIRQLKVDYVDLITEPGPDKVLSENKALDIIESIKRRTLVSIEKHGSKVVIIAGHHDCAANPVEKEEHCRQINEAVQSIKKWNLKVDVYGVWVNEDWKTELI